MFSRVFCPIALSLLVTGCQSQQAFRDPFPMPRVPAPATGAANPNSNYYPEPPQTNPGTTSPYGGAVPPTTPSPQPAYGSPSGTTAPGSPYTPPGGWSSDQRNSWRGAAAGQPEINGSSDDEKKQPANLAKRDSQSGIYSMVDDEKWTSGSARTSPSPQEVRQAGFENNAPSQFGSKSSSRSPQIGKDQDDIQKPDVLLQPNPPESATPKLKEINRIARNSTPVRQATFTAFEMEGEWPTSQPRSIAEKGVTVVRSSDQSRQHSRSDFDYATDYTSLKGRLEFSETSKVWKLRYIPLDGETDNYGGSVVLDNDNALQGFQEGELVRVTGEIVTGMPMEEGFAPWYRVSEIERMAE